MTEPIDDNISDVEAHQMDHRASAEMQCRVEKLSSGNVLIEAVMTEECALVIQAIMGRITGSSHGPRGVASLLYSRISNTLQSHDMRSDHVFADEIRNTRLLNTFGPLRESWDEIKSRRQLGNV